MEFAEVNWHSPFLHPCSAPVDRRLGPPSHDQATASLNPVAKLADGLDPAVTVNKDEDPDGAPEGSFS
jgi:hypothetical protein